MNKKLTYTVAGHSFCLMNQQHDGVWEQMMPQYAPFIDNRVQDTLFSVTVCDELPEAEDACLVYKAPTSNAADTKIDVYRTSGGHLFELTPCQEDALHSLLHLTADLRTARLLLRGDEAVRLCSINMALLLCYLLATLCRNTVLMHASAIVNQGKSYLFLGRSGTGKSTHSNLWLQHIAGSQLLNDDHPILRTDATGQVTAYGSPWSGKTPCYRNQSAPVGGIVRIKQAPQNHIRQQLPIEAYASLLTSCSGMSWNKDWADGKHHTLQQIVSAVPCYTLECLPDEEAAVLCAGTLRKEDG